MAIRVNPGKWLSQVRPLLSWILLTGLVKCCWSCHSESRHLHACLHIFLERDYPLIQAYQAPPDVTSRHMVLLEGPALESICKRIKDLDYCLEDEAVMCRGLYNLEPYRRLMRAFRAIEHRLCRDNMAEFMMYLKHFSCLENFRSSLPECRDNRISWDTVWIKIFRLQTETEVCPSLVKQRDCVLNNWKRSPCKLDARNFYNDTFTTWLDIWCGNGTDLRSPFHVLIFIFLELFAIRSYFI